MQLTQLSMLTNIKYIVDAVVLPRKRVHGLYFSSTIMHAMQGFDSLMNCCYYAVVTNSLRSNITTAIPLPTSHTYLTDISK